ncbi:Glypican-6 [Mactra antiquata]
MADSRPSSFVFFCVFVVCFSNLYLFAQSLDLSCIEVKKEYLELGFKDENSVPISPISGDHLQVCPRGSTCCTSDMESKLKSLSMKHYENVENEAFKFIRSTFVSRTKKFDDFFTELLDNAKDDLHEMFVRTYGLLYQQNSEVFSDLFRDLKLYYKGNNMNLVNILNNFFKSLLQRMFQLLNGQYQFEQEYLNCVTKHMDELKPFGDVPQKLKLQVKRAFIAARTFVQGLAIGRDVILSMERIKPTEACTLGMTRMMSCPLCRGLTRTKPCNNYCLNTMKGCLAHHSELNMVWNEYIEALKMVAQRLEGPFNIETVVDPIDVKISEAIMNFQEDAGEVTERIFKGCGDPRKDSSYRYKRQSASNYDEYAYGKEFISYTRNGGGSNERPATAAGTNLDRLVKDIKDKVEEARNFWVQLPYYICNGDIAAQPGEDDDCWNGQDRAKYVAEVQKDGRIYQLNNPEVTVDVQEDNGIISVQINNLKLITTKLHNAYHGVDVEWNVPPLGRDIVGSGDDLDASGDGNKGGRIVASGDRDNDNYDTGYDDDDYSGGSGSGDDFDDEDRYPYKPGRPDNYNPPQTARPHKPKPTDSDIEFQNPNNPNYNIHNDRNRNEDSGGSSTIHLSTSALLTMFVLYVVRRLVL